MLTQQYLDRIYKLACQVEDKLLYLDTEVLTGLLDSVQDVQGDATELRGMLEDIKFGDDDTHDERTDHDFGEGIELED